MPHRRDPGPYPLIPLFDNRQEPERINYRSVLFDPSIRDSREGTTKPTSPLPNLSPSRPRTRGRLSYRNSKAASLITHATSLGSGGGWVLLSFTRGPERGEYGIGLKGVQRVKERRGECVRLRWVGWNEGPARSPPHSRVGRRRHVMCGTRIECRQVNDVATKRVYQPLILTNTHVLPTCTTQTQSSLTPQFI